jgi:valyl-tRNA synthetase
VKEITDDIENHRYHLAGEKLYHYVWHTFADVIIEESKKKLASTDAQEQASARRILFEILETSLKMLHPFIPFVTEEIWSLMPDRKSLLIVEKWPQ